MIKKIILPLLFLLFVFNLSAQELKKDTTEAKQHYESAKQDYNKKRYKEAKLPIQKALALYKKHPISTAALEAMLLDAEIDNGLNELSSAEQKLQEMLKQPAKLLAIDDMTGKIYALWGGIRRDQKRYEEGLELLEKALSGEAGNRKLEAYLLSATMDKGACLDALGRYAESTAVFEEGLELAKNIYNDSIHINIAGVYNAIAIGYYRQGAYYRAIDFMEKNIEIATKLGSYNKKEMADKYSNLGVMYLKTDSKEKSIDYLERAIKLYPAVGAEAGLAGAINNLGVALRNLGRYEEAIAAYNKSLAMDLKKYGPEHVEVSKSYQNIAALYYVQKDYEKATQFLKKALTIRQKTYKTGKHPDLAGTLLDLGKNASFLNDHKAAMEYTEAAMLANVLELGNLEGISIKDYTEKYTHLGFIATENILSFRGRLFLDLYNKNGNLADLLEAQNTQKSLCSFLLNRIKNLSKSQDKGLLLNELTGYHRRSIEISYMLYEKTKDIKHLEYAFEISEIEKTVLLMETLNADDALRFGDLPDSVAAKQISLRRDIAKLEGQLIAADSAGRQAIKNQIFAKRDEENVFSQELQNSYPRYYEAVSKIQVANAGQIQASLLDAKTTLIEYYIADSSIFIFVVDKSKPLSCTRIAFDSLQKKNINNFINNTQNYKYLNEQQKEWAEAAHNCYKMLLSPVLSQKNKSERLLIIPDKLLFKMPFEVLLTAAPKSEEDANFYKNLPYLLQRYTCSYSYSASLLLENEKQAARLARNNKGDILGLAPSYEQLPKQGKDVSNKKSKLFEIRSRLDSLPAAKQEIKHLESRYRGRFLYGTEASEAKYKTIVEQHSIIHLAMHGVSDAKQPLNSAMVFSENTDSTEDGFLYAYEISQLPNNAQLVVLSACETGVGNWQAGQGVMSLARSFMYAGTPSLLVSLWQVNDRATAMLMEDYYRYLAKGMPKDRALQLAKIDYIKKADAAAAHPLFWAAFVQLGDTKPIRVPSKGSWLPIMGVGVLLLAGVLLLWVKRKR